MVDLRLLGRRAVDAGMAFTPGGIAAVLMMPLVCRLISKVDVRVTIIRGRGTRTIALDGTVPIRVCSTQRSDVACET